MADYPTLDLPTPDPVRSALSHLIAVARDSKGFMWSPTVRAGVEAAAARGEAALAEGEEDQ